MANELSIEERDSRGKKSFTAILVGLIANILLAVIKTSIGVLGHSPALLADGINSTSDVAYYVVVSVFVKIANKPADEVHPYGHSQLESIGALVVGSFVITTAVAIFWNSVDTIYDLISGVGTYTGATSLTLIVAMITVLVKIGLTIYTQAVGRTTKNPSITALAFDHRNDIFSAMAAVIGIFLGRQGYYWVDPLAGAMVAFVILRTGIEILRDSTADLMDTAPGKALFEQIHGLLDPLDEVYHIDAIQTHRFGPYFTINITICIEGSLTVEEGDQISTLVENRILNNIDLIRSVHVHYHPYSKHQHA